METGGADWIRIERNETERRRGDTKMGRRSTVVSHSWMGEIAHVLSSAKSSQLPLDLMSDTVTVLLLYVVVNTLISHAAFLREYCVTTMNLKRVF